MIAVRDYKSGADIPANANAIRNRLMNPTNAYRLKKPEAKVINLAARGPLWKRTEIHFDMHVRVWQWRLANRKTAKHLEFIRVRSIELGFGSADIVGPDQSKDVVRARQRIMYELREQFKLSYPHIGRLMNRDHTSAIAAVRKHQLMLSGEAVDRFTNLDRLRADVEGMKKAREMYEVGHSIAEVARFLHVSRDTFVTVAKQQGWYDASRASTRAYNFQAMKRDYEDGMAIRDLCQKYDISERTWYFMRTKKGVPNRPRVGKESA